MKRILTIVAACVWGILLAFFGVFVSVFADGALQERLITIAAILCIYLVSGGLWAYIGSFWSWNWAVILGLPGALLLMLYSVNEIGLAPYYLLYILGILGFTWAGSRIGRRVRRRKR